MAEAGGGRSLGWGLHRFRRGALAVWRSWPRSWGAPIMRLATSPTGLVGGWSPACGEPPAPIGEGLLLGRAWGRAYGYRPSTLVSPTGQTGEVPPQRSIFKGAGLQALCRVRPEGEEDCGEKTGAPYVLGGRGAASRLAESDISLIFPVKKLDHESGKNKVKQTHKGPSRRLCQTICVCTDRHCDCKTDRYTALMRLATRWSCDRCAAKRPGDKRRWSVNSRVASTRAAAVPRDCSVGSSRGSPDHAPPRSW